MDLYIAIRVVGERTHHNLGAPCSYGFSSNAAGCVLEGLRHFVRVRLDLTVAMTLRQVLFAVAQYGVVPKYAKNSTTQAKGSQLGTKATTNQTALASMYASKLGGNSTELLLEKEIPRRT